MREKWAGAIAIWGDRILEYIGGNDGERVSEVGDHELFRVGNSQIPYKLKKLGGHGLPGVLGAPT
ncbi:hypothetical protein [Halobaculum roseum]|uniref:Uncharacterized protein n=1 Tax=Halobaculum roseum TaxID=2175149 RepID=A0ABD5MLJ8_9EURY|nr:hypothetical protein [Halobaculum roseum]QZY03935.1 hypothetical protein K6T36_07170 [Halobaculum roseum]